MLWYKNLVFVSKLDHIAIGFWFNLLLTFQTQTDLQEEIKVFQFVHFDLILFVVWVRWIMLEVYRQGVKIPNWIYLILWHFFLCFIQTLHQNWHRFAWEWIKYRHFVDEIFDWLLLLILYSLLLTFINRVSNHLRILNLHAWAILNWKTTYGLDFVKTLFQFWNITFEFQLLFT